MISNKKRNAEGGPSPALKRRKPSTTSISSLHPLRQTSFPPDESSPAASPYAARSPSVDDTMSLVSGSQVSLSMPGSVAPVRKKRGRKSKAEKAREQTPSVAAAGAATTAGSAAGSRSGRGGAGGGGDEEEEDEDVDREVVEVAATGQERTAEQKAEEHRLRGMLINAFTPEQFDRYENWRAAGLAKNAVRRLVNATVSQSVTEPVILGVRSVAKVYIGDIIECARRVQAEWAAKLNEKQTDLPTPEPSPRSSPAQPQPADDGESGPATDETATPASTNAAPAAPATPAPATPTAAPSAAAAPATAIPATATPAAATPAAAAPADVERDENEGEGAAQEEGVHETPAAAPAGGGGATAAPAAGTQEEKKPIRYGPLRPEHLREAVRRYKVCLEGGGVGMHGLWHHQQHSGVERFGIRTRGRRLFR